MKTTYQIFLTALCTLILNSCNKGPHPIDYGNDGCHFCKMTIVDKIHGAELITETGKIFKFDATECMYNHLKNNSALTNATLLTNYYESPTYFITAKEAVFLISEKLPSPMGANLTAFQTKENAEKMHAEKGGKLYTWEELQAHLNK